MNTFVQDIAALRPDEWLLLIAVIALGVVLIFFFSRLLNYLYWKDKLEVEAESDRQFKRKLWRQKEEARVGAINRKMKRALVRELEFGSPKRRRQLMTLLSDD